MTQESYDGYMAACGEDTAKMYQDFLDNYEIGGEIPSPDTLPPYEPPAPPEPQKPNYMKTDAADLPDGTPKIVTHVDFMGETYHVDIWPKQAIRLTGSYKNHVNGPVPFDITFKIGDRAEYDSYNLSYVGDIVSIGPKTVTIKHDGFSDRKSRLDLKHFAWRNWDFDAERIAKEHANWCD